jgi:hypothetical protein
MNAATEEILQSFLNRGLFNIGDSDVRLGYFRNAAQSLAKQWQEDRTRIIPAVLASLDPSVPTVNSTIKDAEEALQVEWNTYRNAYPDPPRQFLRALVLEALRIVGAADIRCAGAIWLTGVSVLPFPELGREEEVVSAMLQGFGRTHESIAQKIWEAPEIVSDDQITIGQLTYTKVVPKTLEERLGAASGPNNPQNAAYPQPSNPHWPNAGQPWSNAFPPIAAAAISEAVNGAIAATVGGLSKPFAEITKVAASARDTIKQQLIGPTGVSGRTHLLWWRQAMFSPRLRCGYREMHPATAAFLMALDLSDGTNPQTPLSVEYFLREAIRDISENREAGSDQSTLGEIVSSALKDKGQAHLRSALQETNKTGVVASGYVPLLQIVASMATESGYRPELFATRVGVRADQSLSLADVAVWLFRDMQAARLLTVGGTDAL